MNNQEMFDLVDLINREMNMNESLEIDELRASNGITITNFFSSPAIKALLNEVESRGYSLYFSGVRRGLVIH